MAVSFHSMVNMQPFCPVFPPADSKAKVRSWLSLWNFKEKASAIFYDTANQKRFYMVGPASGGRCNPARRPHLQPMGPAILPESFEMPNLPVPRRDGPAFHPYSAAPDQPCRTGGFAPVVTARRSFQVAPCRTGTFPHQAQRYKERKSSPRAVQGRAGGGSIILRVGPDL